MFSNCIYVDSRLRGSARLVLEFIEDRVFSVHDSLFCVKSYYSSRREWLCLSKRHGVNLDFFLDPVGPRDGRVFYYPISAQSNLRNCERRSAAHVFIGHGDSYKAASARAQFRICDHVAIAGEAAAERLLKSRIFKEVDIYSGRLLMVGDTFVGATGLSQSGGETCFLYAPTWEGVSDKNNYSSLKKNWSLFVFNSARQLNIDLVVLKAHPNTGSRLRSYRRYFLQGVVDLLGMGLRVVVSAEWLGKVERLLLSSMFANFQFVESLLGYSALFAVCDVSAMESKFLAERIPYAVYVDECFLPVDVVPAHYGIIGFCSEFELTNILRSSSDLSSIYNDCRSRFFGFYTDELDGLSKSDRLKVVNDFIAA